MICAFEDRDEGDIFSNDQTMNIACGDFACDDFADYIPLISWDAISWDVIYSTLIVPANNCNNHDQLAFGHGDCYVYGCDVHSDIHNCPDINNLRQIAENTAHSVLSDDECIEFLDDSITSVIFQNVLKEMLIGMKKLE
jgi:hypothetical protein